MNLFRNQIGVLICTLVLALFSSQAFAKLEVTDSVKVFKGQLGLNVQVVRTKPLESNKALVQIKGTDTHVDGLTFLADYSEKGNGDAYYVIQFRGRPWSVLRHTKSWGWRQIQYTQPGDMRKQSHVWYDETESQKANAKSLLSQYKKDLSSRKLASVTDFNRKQEQDEVVAEVQKTQLEVKEACDHDVKVSFDWTSIDDETFKELSIASLCSYPLGALRDMCSGDEKFKSRAAKVKSLNCQFNQEMKLKVEGNEIKWSFDKAASNIQDFALQNIKNLL